MPDDARWAIMVAFAVFCLVLTISEAEEGFPISRLFARQIRAAAGWLRTRLRPLSFLTVHCPLCETRNYFAPQNLAKELAAGRMLTARCLGCSVSLSIPLNAHPKVKKMKTAAQLLKLTEEANAELGE